MPGSTHRSWNKEWPVLRILQRCEGGRPPRPDGRPPPQLDAPDEFELLLDCTAATHPMQTQPALPPHLQQQPHGFPPGGYPGGGGYGGAYGGAAWR